MSIIKIAYSYIIRSIWFTLNVYKIQYIFVAQLIKNTLKPVCKNEYTQKLCYTLYCLPKKHNLQHHTGRCSSWSIGTISWCCPSFGQYMNCILSRSSHVPSRKTPVSFSRTKTARVCKIKIRWNCFSMLIINRVMCNYKWVVKKQDIRFYQQ